MGPDVFPIAAIGEIAGSDIVDCAANLVAKSLVAADLGGATGWYRLLKTTRAYALEKLTQSGEFEQVARRHAEYCRDLFERAELQTRPASEWLAAFGRRIDNLCAALDWAFSPTGDVAIGVALTIAAVPLWMQLSLVQECRARVERALASLVPEADRSTRQEMKLYAALGASLSAGNPVATTYWRWRLIGDPFAIYQPASSAVGMYQMTDAAFAEAEGYCIVHHAVVETGCSATALHSRVVPRHATELTAVFLDRNVAAILGYRRKTKISRQQREELAAVIHLCGTGPATAFAQAGRRSPKDRTIPRPKPEKPLGGARPRAPLL
jgi:hypothetical protein